MLAVEGRYINRGFSSGRARKAEFRTGKERPLVVGQEREEIRDKIEPSNWDFLIIYGVRGP